MKKKRFSILTFLKDKLNNKKGSTTIFVLLILSSIITLTVMMVNISKDKAQQGCERAALSLSSRSVLSEYHSSLKEKYGIFGLNMTPSEISKKMDFYIRKNTGKKAKNISIFTGNKRLTDISNFENEIVSYAKFAFVDHVIDKVEEDKEENKEEGEGEFEGEGDEEDENGRIGNRVLRNEKIINSLPTHNKNLSDVSSSDVADAMGDIDSLFDKGKKTVLANIYILNLFNNEVDDNGDTFFKHEVEYIIAGKLSDEKNYKSVKRKIVLARNIINLAVIYKSPKLKAEVVSMAALIGLGVEFAIPLIAEAWALLESNNDMAILENGGKIPVVKNDETWATDIESILSNEEDSYIDNDCETGMNYEDYLHVLLYFTDKETKYLRAMDLMQINIQGQDDEEFYINTVVTGFGYDIKLDGGRYRYDESY